MTDAPENMQIVRRQRRRLREQNLGLAADLAVCKHDKERIVEVNKRLNREHDEDKRTISVLKLEREELRRELELAAEEIQRLSLELSECRDGKEG